MSFNIKNTYKILIVDDDKIIRAMLHSIFKDERYSITEADSGEMALEIIPEIMPNLVLLDIMMSGIDGLEVLKRIRANDKFKFIKIILLSSKSDVQERLKGYELGTDDYMIKPFVGGELLAKVNVFMRMDYMENKNSGLEELVRKEVEKHKQQEEYLLSKANLISMGDMVIAIGHHWRQPLNALGLTIQDIHDAFLHGELTEEYLSKSVDSAMKNITFMSETIDSFFQTVKDDKSDHIFCASCAMAEVITLMKSRLDAENIFVTVNSLPWEAYLKDTTVKYYIRGKEWILKQAFADILHNSADAVLKKSRESREKGMEFKGIIRIKLWKDLNTVYITVTDNGPGIPEDKIQRVFEPYYTTKEQGEGVGLGLYFSRTLIEKQFGGKFFIKNSDNASIFCIELPEAPGKDVQSSGDRV